MADDDEPQAPPRVPLDPRAARIANAAALLDQLAKEYGGSAGVANRLAGLERRVFVERLVTVGRKTARSLLAVLDTIEQENGDSEG